MDFGVGDVVTVEGLGDGLYMVVAFENFEDEESCSYDRCYGMVPVRDMVRDSIIVFKTRLKWVRVRGAKGTESKPSIKRVEGEIPYNITRLDAFELRKKKARTITVYD